MIETRELREIMRLLIMISDKSDLLEELKKLEQLPDKIDRKNMNKSIEKILEILNSLKYRSRGEMRKAILQFMRLIPHLSLNRYLSEYEQLSRYDKGGDIEWPSSALTNQAYKAIEEFHWYTRLWCGHGNKWVFEKINRKSKELMLD